jgi:phytoene dehydrogenase-like protein
MPVVDFLDEYFESDFIKGVLSMGAVLGTFTAPRSPGTTLHLLLQEALAGMYFKGGATALTTELEQRARSLGVQIQTGAPVMNILVSDRRVRGVELEDGTEILADAVSASCNPRTVLLDLLPVGAIDYTTEHRISNFRCRGTAAQLLFAVDGPVVFSDGAAEHELQRVRIAPTATHVERAFDAVKYGELPDEPVLDIAVPTLEQPSLAPSGKSVVSVLVGYAPYELEGGWTDAARDRLTSNVIATLGRHIQDFETRLIAAKLSTPADLESEYGLSGGSLYHGEPGIDQLVVRPIPECFDHRTPIAGLSLCGSGTHPGGTVSCMAASLAKRAVLHPQKSPADAAA